MSLRSTLRQVYRKLPDGIKPFVVHIGRTIVTSLEDTINGEFPATVAIETNTCCTRKCSYCPKDPEEKITLDDDLFYSIVDQLKEAGFKGRFTPCAFNEPLTDKRIFEFISYARKKLDKCDITILSNGDLLGSNVLERLFDTGMSEIRVSVHDPSTQEFAMCMKNLAKSRKGVVFSDMREGYRIDPISNRGGSVKIGPVRSLVRCYHVNALTIRANGQAVLCCQDYNKAHVFGNARENTVMNIWNNPEYSKLRSEIKKGHYFLPICKMCGYDR